MTSAGAPTAAASNAASNVQSFVNRLLRGDRAAASRLMTVVENRALGYRELLRLITPHTGRAHVIGVTGPPGAGKSSLVNELIRHYRSQHKKVGVVAVDPSSAVSGGAILGDRIRMLSFYNDPQVFIRSMASRGQLGGLAATTVDVARVLDASGCDIVIVETVGVGQDEVSIAELADTTLLIEVPGMGDDVQVLKAGILEIADVFVINKADREGADRLANQIKTAMRLLPYPKGAWIPLIVKTVAVEGRGIVELAQAIENHRAYLAEGDRLQTERRARLKIEVLERARDIILRRLTTNLEGTATLDRLLDDLVSRKLDPTTAAHTLIDESKS